MAVETAEREREREPISVHYNIRRREVSPLSSRLVSGLIGSRLNEIPMVGSETSRAKLGAAFKRQLKY